MGMGMGMGQHVVLARDLTVDDVRHFLDHRIQMQGYSRLKVGEVGIDDGDAISAEIITLDGAQVQKLEIDRHTGALRVID